MIFPWLKGLILYYRAPLTWTIVFLNLFFYLMTWDSQRAEKTFFNENDDLVHLGMMYSQYKNENSEKLQQIAKLERKEKLMMAGQALKDPDFLINFSKQKYFGDQLAVNTILAELKRYNQNLESRWTTQLGLNNYNSTAINWITYQFMHASWMHVIGNMVMVIIFAGALEIMIGSLALLFVYIFSGIVGAYFFLLLSPISASPMVGASGAVSGLIAFYAIFEAKRRVAFIFFVSPMPGYFGQIYLPTLLLYPLIFLPDVAGLLASKNDFGGGGVAYAAHVGGALFGIILGLVFRHYKKSTTFRWLFQH